MYSTHIRIRLAKEKANLRQHQRRSDQLFHLSILCTVLTGLDIWLMAYGSQRQTYHSPADWPYGATLLPSSVGGYILVAILSFMVAVVVTTSCLKHRDHSQKQEGTSP